MYTVGVERGVNILDETMYMRSMTPCTVSAWHTENQMWNAYISQRQLIYFILLVQGQSGGNFAAYIF